MTALTSIDVGFLRHSENYPYFVEESQLNSAYYRGELIVGWENGKMPITEHHKCPQIRTVGRLMTKHEFEEQFLEDMQLRGIPCRVYDVASFAIEAAAAAGAPLAFPAGSFRAFILQAAQEANWPADLLQHLPNVLSDAYYTIRIRDGREWYQKKTNEESRQAKCLAFKDAVRNRFCSRPLDQQTLDRLLNPAADGGLGLLDRAIADAMIKDARNKNS